MVNLKDLQSQIIGNDAFFSSPYGKRRITYADYTATGRTLRFIEDYLISIQKWYANTHTDDSFTGLTMSALIHKAEKMIKASLGANENNYIIPIGTGSTGAISKLCEILGLYLTPGLKHTIDHHLKNNNRQDQAILQSLLEQMTENKPVIFIAPYEHHSNYLIWHECLVEVIEIKLNAHGEMDLNDLEAQLSNPDYQNRIKIGSFSAASNITGIRSDVYTIARMVHAHDGLVFFDFAASGPYVEINMNKDDTAYFDAIFLSPHKYIGGPGSCGILVIHKHLYSTLYAPTVAGGGTVQYVSPFFYDFTSDVESREKAGTPGILQILKASLALELKDHIGVNQIEKIEQHYLEKAFTYLEKQPNIIILGPTDPKKRIGILSFNIIHEGKYLHPKLITKLLNDLFGIQSRAGCACAGPYGHRLLHIDNEVASQIREAVIAGYHSLKPGFVRVNFHYLMDEKEVDFILMAIAMLANFGYLFLSQYQIDLKTGSWHHHAFIDDHQIITQFGVNDAINHMKTNESKSTYDKSYFYELYLNQAVNIITQLPKGIENQYQHFFPTQFEALRWFNFIKYIQ